MAIGGLALPSATASAAVPGRQHSRPALLSADGMLEGVVVMSSSDAWAVGEGFRDQSLRFTPFLARWDGSTWSQVTGGAIPPRGFLSAITSFKGGAWAVGAAGGAGSRKPLIMRLRGSAWARVPYPDNGYGHLTAVAASSPANAWAVGSSLDDAGEGTRLIVHWNGKAWKLVPSPALPATSFLRGVATTSPTSAWAVGNSEPGATFILHWNGKRWRRVRSPGMTGKNATLTSVTATSAKNAWAVGSDAGKTLILHWDGTKWKRVPSPSPGGGPSTGPGTGPDNALGGVAASSATSAWAVGWGSTRGLSYAPLTLHWNGRTWQHVAAPDPPSGGFLNGVGIGPSGRAWAVGYTESPLLTLFEHWSGSAWH